MFPFFLSSGLFLGWSLGSNDASNVFGTAVGTKMIRFRTAAICCSIFVILGAVISGAGASHTLGKLGAVNAIAGAFIVALSSAISVYLMTKAKYPVSTSQAIVGAIIGWNFFTGSLTDYNSLTKIVSTWIICPVLAAFFSVSLYKIVVLIVKHFRPHMLSLDYTTRYGLLLAGIFGSYSLGANNIANVMGVFVPVSPFADISIMGIIKLTAAQQLFLIGGIAIAVGVITYSKNVMLTVGQGIVELSPVGAFVVVTAHSLVLFLFASQSLERFLIEHGLPSIPLVPVSSSQAIVGAVIGIGLLKSRNSIRWSLVGGITSSWIVTPIISGLTCLISLFFLQNVFEQNTYRPVKYRFTPEALYKMSQSELSEKQIETIKNIKTKEFKNAVIFVAALKSNLTLDPKKQEVIMNSCEIDEMKVSKDYLAKIDNNWISIEQKKAIESLDEEIFIHQWLLHEALIEKSATWRFKENNKDYNENLKHKLKYIYDLFRENYYINSCP